MPFTVRPLTGWLAFAAWCSKNMGWGLACCLTWWAGAGWRGTQLRSCPPRRPMAGSSSFTPLRRVPRQPAPLGWVTVQPLQSTQVQSRRGRGGWRSEVTAELTAPGRRGGHSRSHPPQPLRRRLRPNEALGFGTPLARFWAVLHSSHDPVQFFLKLFLDLTPPRRSRELRVAEKAHPVSPTNRRIPAVFFCHFTLPIFHRLFSNLKEPPHDNSNRPQHRR